jgi:hypothetical protein
MIKWHLDVGPMAKHKVIYKGEGGGFPSKSNGGEFYESVFACGSLVHQKCSNYALINLLFSLYTSMWVIDLLFILPNFYPDVPTHPSTPKMLQARKRTPTPHSSIVFTLDWHLNLLSSLGMCQLLW